MMLPNKTETPAALHEVITFYSYKGGTGRTMALANVACLFAKQGGQSRRVLAIDWDLEAPGLHYYLRPPGGDAIDSNTAGVVEYFTQVLEIVKDGKAEGEDQDAQAEAILVQIPFDGFSRPTSVSNVELMPAGCLDADYQSRLAKLDWHLIYQRAPGLFRAFAHRVARDYDVVLVDSRTGMTDISGICTSLLPDKLVVVFTANQQSLTGIERLVRSSVEYRQGSRDVRPLLVYPLPSRIDAERDKLRALWRHGNKERRIEGFQPQFERILRSAYALESCDLTNYCNEVQVQHSPDYSYGEGVAALDAPEADRFSIVRSYQALLRWLETSAAPWETPESAQLSKRLEALLRAEEEALKEDPPKDPRRLMALQEEIVQLAVDQHGPQHLETISAMERLIRTGLQRGGDISRSIELLDRLVGALPQMRIPIRAKSIGSILSATGTLRAHGDWDNSHRVRRAAIEALRRSEAELDTASLDVLEDIGVRLQEAYALNEAKALQERVLEIRRRVLGAEDPDTLASMNNLAETLRVQGDLSGARALHEPALKVRRRVLAACRASDVI